MQKVRSHLRLRLLLFVCMRFQVLFHSPPGVLFAFPSRYYSSIGHRLVFSLGRWSSLLPTGFLVSHGTLEHNLLSDLFCLQDYHLLRLSFPALFDYYHLSFYCVLNPRQVCFGLFPVRSPLLRKSMFLSFPPAT